MVNCEWSIATSRGSGVACKCLAWGVAWTVGEVERAGKKYVATRIAASDGNVWSYERLVGARRCTEVQQKRRMRAAGGKVGEAGVVLKNCTGDLTGMGKVVF